MAETIKNLPVNDVMHLGALLPFEVGRIVTRSLAQTPGCRMTIVAMDRHEEMASHAASGDALIQCLEGSGEITVEGQPHVIQAGESLLMEKGAPHTVRALTHFKFLITIVF